MVQKLVHTHRKTETPWTGSTLLPYPRRKMRGNTASPKAVVASAGRPQKAVMKPVVCAAGGGHGYRCP